MVGFGGINSYIVDNVLLALECLPKIQLLYLYLNSGWRWIVSH